MLKQLRITIKGLYNIDEFMNMLADKVSRFNLEQKDPKHSNVTGYMEGRSENACYIHMEGDEEDLKTLALLAKRGPVISRIDSVREEWGKHSGRYKTFARKLYFDRIKGHGEKKVLFHKKRRR